MNQDQILSIVRTILKCAGSVLVTRGLTTDAGLETGLGAIITLAGFVWSMVTHKSDPTAPTPVSK